MTKQKAPTFQARQGDVLIERVAALPKSAALKPRDNNRVILAYGEVTGHAHAIDTAADPDAALFDAPDGNGFFLRIESVTGVVHEEHARIDLPEGIYRGRIQREWTDADEPRQVLD